MLQNVPKKMVILKTQPEKQRRPRPFFVLNSGNFLFLAEVTKTSYEIAIEEYKNNNNLY